jgi:RNA polymerase sigma factor (sigma-70 family)
MQSGSFDFNDTQLLFALWKVLVAHARRVLGKHYDAEAATQNTFLGVINHPDYPNISTGLIWTIHRRRMVDILRTAFRDKNLSEVPDELPGDEHPTIDFAACRKGHLRLHEAITTLPTEDQLLVYLYYFGGSSTDQICDVLGVSKDAYYKRHQRILRRLKRLLVPPDDPEAGPSDDDPLDPA